MTPDVAFREGARANLRNAYLSGDANGRFLCGEIHGDTMKHHLDGEKFQTSYLTKKIDKDIWLTRTGVTYFVESWATIYDDL